MKEARLYEVKSPRGDSIYSIYDPQAQWVWTERSELAARQIAREKGYQLIEGGQITHAQMLGLIGSDVAPTATPSPVKAAETKKPADPPAPPPIVTVTPAISPDGAMRIAPPMPNVVYHWEDELPAEPTSLKPILPEVADMSTVQPPWSVFQSKQPLKQEGKDNV